MSGRAKRRRQREAAGNSGGLSLRRDPAAPQPPQSRDLVCRAIQLRAATLVDADRSIEAVMATERPTPVFDMQRFEVIDEVLVARGAEFGEQVVLLDSHFKSSLDDVLGSTRNIRVEGDRVIGRLFFADDDASGRAWGKVKAGHVTDVSVGYRAVDFVDIPAGRKATVDGQTYTAGRRTLRVTTRWQIRELSVVPIGADAAAKFRSDPPPNLESVTMNPQLRAYLESLGMRHDAEDTDAWKFFDRLGGTARAAAVALHNDDPQGRQRIDDAPPPANSAANDGNTRQSRPDANAAANSDANAGTPATPDHLRQQARDEERTRVRTLREMAGADVPAALLNRAIDDGWNTERAGREFLAAVRGQRSEPVGDNGNTNGRAPAGHSRSRERDLNIRGLAAQVAELAGLNPVGLAMRGLAGEDGAPITISEQDADRGRNYLIRNSIDFMREALRIEGIREPRDEHEFFRAAFSTLAANAIFTTSAYARLVQGYENAPDTTDWCQSEEVANFQVHDDITMGKAGSPKLLERGGIAQHATFDAQTEQFRALRYALQLRIAEEDIIDDRLGAILQTGTMELAETFAEMRPDLVYSLILENPNLVQTGNAAFGGSGHNNTTTTALSRSALTAANVAMAKQRINGRVVNNRPRYLVVGTDLEDTAFSLLNSTEIFIKGNTDSEQGNINTIRRLGLQARSEGRLTTAGVWDPKNAVQRAGSATNWFLFSDRRTVKVVYRRGTGRRPTMRSYVLSQGQWGIGWDINLDIGVGFSDYVGCFRGNV